MKFFIDTANLDEIKEANELGLIVTSAGAGGVVDGATGAAVVLVLLKSAAPHAAAPKTAAASRLAPSGNDNRGFMHDPLTSLAETSLNGCHAPRALHSLAVLPRKVSLLRFQQPCPR